MSDVLFRSTSRARFNTLLMTMFALCALVLAAVGIYGLIAYSVQQRTQEIGIRMALGAGARDIRNMVMANGMRLAVAGVIIGVISSIALAKAISGFLFGVQPHDPAVFAVVPLVVIVVVLFAV